MGALGLAQTTMTQLQEVAKYGGRAIYQACVHGYREVVKFLTCSSILYLMIETDCDLTAVNSHDTTLLQVAWESKHWEVASYLLQVMRECPGQISGLPSTAIMQLLERMLSMLLVVMETAQYFTAKNPWLF